MHHTSRRIMLPDEAFFWQRVPPPEGASARERIARAFSALTSAGWFAVPRWGCCREHGIEAARSAMPHALAYLFTTEDSDECFDVSGNIVKPVNVFFEGRFLKKDPPRSADLVVGRHAAGTLSAQGLVVTWNDNANSPLLIRAASAVS